MKDHYKVKDLWSYFDKLFIVLLLFSLNYQGDGIAFLC